MTIVRCLTVTAASLAISLTVGAAPTAAQTAHILVPAEKVQWGPAPPGLPAAMIALMCVMWSGYARVARGQALALRDSDFVLANTHGFSAGYPASKASISASVVAEDADGMQRD